MQKVRLAKRLTREERWRLTKAGPKDLRPTPGGARNFACPEKAPGPGSYPIHDLAHAVSAMTYWNRPYTQKCPGGKERICRAFKGFGYDSPATRQFCGS